MLTLTLYFRKKFRNLNLESIYKLQMGKFMYPYKSGLLPDSFNTDAFIDTPGALLHMALEDRSSFIYPIAGPI